MSTTIWGIHTQDDHLFLNKNVIAIGWREFGDLSAIEPTREAFKKHYEDTYPGAKKGSIATSAGMLFRFAHEVQIGDYVVFPSKSNREINIGIIEGDYTYKPDSGEYVQQRPVKWLKHLPRTSFSQGALYEVGSTLSFFVVKTPIIRGINGTELVDLILKYYDQLSEKYRKMIPLKMVYIPVAKEDSESL